MIASGGRAISRTLKHLVGHGARSVERRAWSRAVIPSSARNLLAGARRSLIWSRARGARAPATRGENSKSKRAALATPYRRSASSASEKQIPRRFAPRDDNDVQRSTRRALRSTLYALRHW